MRWVRFSGELEYHARIPDLMKKLADQPTKWFAGIDHCTGILPRPILQWYMFMHSDYWDEDTLFEVHARISKKIVIRDGNGRCTNVDVPGLLVGWKDVGIYNVSNDDRRAFYK